MRRKIKRIIKKVNPKQALIVLVSLLILSGIFTILPTPKKISFEEVFYEIEKLDEKYETSFKKEKIKGSNETLINYKNIDPYLEDLKLLRENSYKKIEEPPTEEEQAALMFIDTRTLMLLSQKNYYLGKMEGHRGFVTDKDGFSCSEAGYIINTAYYYNLSHQSGIEAHKRLDKLLSDYTEINPIQKLIGLNENKPKFFYSLLGELKNEVRSNLFALEEFCFMDMSQGLISPVDPIKYNWVKTDKESIKKGLEEKGLNISYTIE